MKKVLYIDMARVLMDFEGGVRLISPEIKTKYDGHFDDVPGIYNLMPPMEGAIESYRKLSSLFDTYVLASAPWNNPSAWSDKVLWVQKYLMPEAHKRLILSHHKNLNDGHFLIDDRLKNGVDKFAGEHIHFGTPSFPDWKSVVKYLMPKAG